MLPAQPPRAHIHITTPKKPCLDPQYPHPYQVPQGALLPPPQSPNTSQLGWGPWFILVPPPMAGPGCGEVSVRSQCTLKQELLKEQGFAPNPPAAAWGGGPGVRWVGGGGQGEGTALQRVLLCL